MQVLIRVQCGVALLSAIATLATIRSSLRAPRSSQNAAPLPDTGAGTLMPTRYRAQPHHIAIAINGHTHTTD